ncbi:MAG: hypothetical protein HYU36_01285 [Planctomycetes bacterium]|nr:hypothetical protein [Planctomycetota bacterium]
MTLPTQIGPGETYAITVEVETPTDRRTIDCRIEVVSSDPIHPVVSIPIKGSVVKEGGGPAASSVSGLIVESVGPGVPLPGTGGNLVQKIRIENGTGRTVRIRFPKGRPSLARPKAEALTLEPGQSAIVDLEVLAEEVGRTDTLPIEVDYPLIIGPK